MRAEIERKFLVTGDSWRAAALGTAIRQGYLANEGPATVRVRVAGETGYLTIKGRPGGGRGLARAEYEYEIPVDEAHALIDSLCLRPLIEKTRYAVEHNGWEWVVDVFAGDNEGLIVAEIELEAEDDVVPLPGWVGTEVTDDPRYLNVNLAKTPFIQWRS